MMTALNWVERDSRRGGKYYTASTGNRHYVVDEVPVGAYDGDPKLTMHDDRYRSTCWGLLVWVGDDTLGPTRLFDSRDDARDAAQATEDSLHGA